MVNLNSSLDPKFLDSITCPRLVSAIHRAKRRSPTLVVAHSERSRSVFAGQSRNLKGWIPVASELSTLSVLAYDKAPDKTARRMPGVTSSGSGSGNTGHVAWLRRHTSFVHLRNQSLLRGLITRVHYSRSGGTAPYTQKPPW